MGNPEAAATGQGIISDYLLIERRQGSVSPALQKACRQVALRPQEDDDRPCECHGSRVTPVTRLAFCRRACSTSGPSQDSHAD